MSFWASLGVTIQDLGCFREACKQNGIEYTENEDERFQYQGLTVVAMLRDMHGSGNGYVVEEKGALRVKMDIDPHYNSIIRRLGRGGGKLGRDYSEMVIRKEARRRGGMVTRTTEDKDGWRTVYVRVA